MDGFGKKATGPGRGGHRPRRVGLWNMGYLAVPCVLFLSLQAASGDGGLDGSGKRAATPVDARLPYVEANRYAGFSTAARDDFLFAERGDYDDTLGLGDIQNQRGFSSETYDWITSELSWPPGAVTAGWSGWWFRFGTEWFQFTFSDIDTSLIDDSVTVKFYLGVGNHTNAEYGLDGLIDVVINPGLTPSTTYTDVLLDNVDPNNLVYGYHQGGSYNTRGTIEVPKDHIIGNQLIVRVVRHPDSNRAPTAPIGTEQPIDMSTTPPTVPPGVYENDDARTVHIGVTCLDGAGGHIVTCEGGRRCVSVVSDMGPIEDCNGNGIADECDLDCGEPGGPCDVPGCGQSDDCQPNVVPDECDIAEGTSEDANGNEIPDECDPSICQSPPELTNSCVEAEDAPGQTFEVWNCGEEMLSYSISCESDSGGDWQSYGQRYAIIVMGGNVPAGSQHYQWYWNDTYSMYTELEGYGFGAENIYFLSYGPSADAHPEAVDAVSTTANIQAAYQWAQQVCTEEDLLYIYWVDHGSPTSFQTNDGLITHAELGTLMQPVVAMRIIGAYNPCYSGAVIDDVSGPGVITTTSQDAFHGNSWGWAGKWRQALRGGTEEDPTDTDGDGYISLTEAYLWICPKSQAAGEHPMYDDNGDGVGHECDQPGFDPNDPTEDGYEGRLYSLDGWREPAREPRTEDVSWLSCSPTEGTSTGEHDTIDVTYHTAGLACGSYAATITITAPEADNSPQIIPVDLEVVTGEDQCIVWAENFDDGDIGDWTIDNPYQPGDDPVTMEPSTEQSVSPDYSFKVSGPYQDFYGGMAAGPTVPVDLDRPFTIRFSFRYESFHWYRFCRFGPVSLVMDNLFLPLLAHVGPGAYLLIGFDDFWEYCPAEAWHDFRIEVDPPSRTFDVYVNEAFIGTADYGDHDTGLRAFHFYEGGGDAPAEPNYVANAYYDNVAVTQGPCEDCNENGVPDEVDIAFGTSEDADGDGIPDECEGASEEGLVAYWCFDDCTPVDCSGHGLNGTNSGAACVEGPEGYGSAYEFTDTDIVRFIPNSWDNSISTAFTVATWVKWYGPAWHGRSMVIFDGRDDSWDHAGFWFGLSTTGRVYLHMNQSDSSILGVSTVPADGDSATHVAVVFDGTAHELRAFVNGQQDTTVSTAAVYRNSSHRPAIGNNHWAPGDHQWATFNGVIDELRIYDRALSAAEIQQLAGGAQPEDCNGNGIPDECDLDCGQPGGPCDVPGCGLSDDCNENDVPDECDIAEGTSEDANSDGVPDECQEPPLEQGLVAYWSFDDGTATDNSGNGHDGTIHGDPQPSSGMCGDGLAFDGDNDYISVPYDPALAPEEYTVVLWYKALEDQLGEMIVKGLSRLYYQIQFQGLGGSADAIEFWYEDQADGDYYVLSPQGYEVGRFFMATMIFTDGTLRAYINDAMVGEEYFGVHPYDNGQGVYIGRGDTGWFSGVIDEVRIYNRALSDAEVAELYGLCAPECEATRDLSDGGSWYCRGMAKTVHILLDTPIDTFAIGVEESPPDGWVEIYNISDGGVYDADYHKIKWGPFFPPFPSELTYEVVTPVDAEGEFCFAGEVSIDGVNEETCGDECIEGPPYMAADEAHPECVECTDCECAICRDGRVQMCEMIGYACAWQSGCNEDLAGMTRAAYVWQNGECYCWSEPAPGEPQAEPNWYAITCPAPESGCCEEPGGGRADGRGVIAAGTGSATAHLPSLGRACRGRTCEIRLPITIDAPEGTSAMALEYEVPMGWTVTAISDHGQWDGRHRKVKWGPFFNELSRTVTFTARQDRGRDLGGQCPPKGFGGTVSFDGINQPIAVE